MAQTITAALLLLGGLTGAPLLPPATGHGLFAPPAEKAPSKEAPKKPELSCKLLTTEAPRGGRLEVEGQAFGKTPVVRIAGRVTRTIERSATSIAVQIHRDSDGGKVTVKAGGVEVECGTLTIIGKD
jgi:hypothetical protein